MTPDRLRWALIGLSGLLLAACANAGPEAPPRLEALALGYAVSFKDARPLLTVSDEKKRLAEDDDPVSAVRAYRRFCKERAAAPRTLIYRAGTEITVRAEDWARTCRAAAGAEDSADKALSFLLSNFSAFRYQGAAKFTGYFTPLLTVSRHEDARYRTPIYAAPPELREANAAHPFLTRAQIDAGALTGRHLELLWAEDPVAVFFLQVQGSGVALLPDGKKLRLVYAGKNQQPYVAIGKELIREGAIPADKISLETIRDWLAEHPERQREMMERNPSYVFFSLAPATQPVTGAAGTELLPERSLAVDPLYHAYGTPVFVGGGEDGRVMFAEDRGSAITGTLRADIYFGAGQAAEDKAGPYNRQQPMIVLLPKAAVLRAHDGT